MALTFHSTVLITEHFNEMLSFYQNVMSMEIQHDFDNCITFHVGLTIWQLKESYPIAKHLGKLYDPSGNKNLELCFETNDLDEFINKLNQYNVEKLHDLTEESWGQRTIRFFDPENNLIEVGESLEALVKRLHSSGMKLNDIEKKTSLPMDMITGFLNGNK
jgi:catechol 2,3-dioxygenase-like lactoylglutathione lyase family enzyme